MMKRAFPTIAALSLAALTLGYSPLWAQKVKSQKESQAILAVQMAKTPDERITAIENVLTNFADTEFKPVLLQMAVQTEQEKGDYAQTMFYAERLLKADPKNAFALVTMASETARHTRENDLDKEDQLSKVDKWAKEGIEDAKTTPKARADVSDADWEGFKKDLQSQGYVALGMADALRKNVDGAISNYKESLTVAATPNPATMVRLAQVYMGAGKLGDANFTLDRAINTPNVPANIKSIAENMKAEIAKRQPAGAAPAAAPPASAPPPSAPPSQN
jgi:tetratricopeptide (TPR) repeat protein